MSSHVYYEVNYSGDLDHIKETWDNLDANEALNLVNDMIDKEGACEDDIEIVEFVQNGGEVSRDELKRIVYYLS